MPSPSPNEGSIIVIGEALIDLIVGPEGEVTAVPGGAPYNVACTCGRLGAPVAFAGAISTDAFGDRLIDGLASDGVGLDGVQRVDAPTTLAVAQIGTGGAVTYRFYLAGTSTEVFDPSGVATATGYLVTGGLALMSDRLVDAVVTAADGGARLVVDVNCRPAAVTDWPAQVERIERAMRSATVVKVSDEDIALMWPDEPIESAIDRIVAHGVAVVIVTAGAAGVRVRVGATTLEVAVPELGTRFVDPVGAGDAFLGAFVAWWVTAGGSGAFDGRGWGDLGRVGRAIERAVEVAALTCTRPGADPPRRDELAVWP